MHTILSIIAIVAAVTTADAAPPPFAVHVVPNMSFDVYPITNAARNAQAATWRRFLSGKDDDWTPSRHVDSIRLTDLERPDGTPYGGWRFSVIVPVAPSPWKAPDLHVAIGGVGLDARPREVVLGSLVLDVVLDRSQLAPGKYTIEGTRGTKTVFALDLVLEDGAPDDPEPIAKSRALDAAAAKRAPFLVAALPAKADCSGYPPPAGCTRGSSKMWRELFVGTLAGHPHTRRFTRTTKAGAALVRWPAYLIFPTGPAGWSHDDPVILLDGKPVPAPHLRDSDTDALIVELKLIDGAWAPGKHQLRAVDKQNTVLFDGEIELLP